MILEDLQVIDPIFLSLKNSFKANKTLSLSYRRSQLYNLLVGLKEMNNQFFEAAKSDLGYNELSNKFYSMDITINDIEHTLNNFEEWNKRVYVDTPLFIGPGKSSYVYEPLGVALVMSAWNYPVYTALPPVASAIAAGNCVILKPSELSPSTSNVLKSLFEKYLDKNCYQVIEGKAEIAAKITTYPFDLIIYTGSPEKGKLVARAAANNLIPCILELGGKNPCIVDQDADIENVALRVVQGRFTNSGQTCVAPDYLIVHEKIKSQVIERLLQKITLFYGSDPSLCPDLARIVSPFHVNRLQKMVDEPHNGKILIGGKGDPQKRFFEPTLIVDPNLDSRIMTEEIFGPILPVIGFKDLNEVIERVKEREKPLCLYYFGGMWNKNKEKILRETSSGSLTFNECLMQTMNSDLPFGGVQNSGQRALHGRFGFESCSHRKAVFDKLALNGKLLEMRYPPFDESKKRKLATFANKTKNLTQGHIIRGIVILLFLSLIVGIALKTEGKGFLDFLKLVLMWIVRMIDACPFRF